MKLMRNSSKGAYAVRSEGWFGHASPLHASNSTGWFHGPRATADPLQQGSTAAPDDTSYRRITSAPSVIQAQGSAAEDDNPLLRNFSTLPCPDGSCANGDSCKCHLPDGTLCPKHHLKKLNSSGARRRRRQRRTEYRFQSYLIQHCTEYKSNMRQVSVGACC